MTAHRGEPQSNLLETCLAGWPAAEARTARSLRFRDPQSAEELRVWHRLQREFMRLRPVQGERGTLDLIPRDTIELRVGSTAVRRLPGRRVGSPLAGEGQRTSCVERLAA